MASAEGHDDVIEASAMKMDIQALKSVSKNLRNRVWEGTQKIDG